MEDALEADQIYKWLFSWGYEIIPLLNLKKGTKIWPEELHPDIILMDILLATNDNIRETIGRIREEKDVPIVYITPNLDSNRELNSIEKGLNFVFRPIDSRELQFTLDMALYKNRMEKTLRESEIKYRLLIENASDPIAVVNYAGEFIMVNRSAARYFGQTRADFQGKTIWDFFPGEYANSQMRNIRKVIDSGKGLKIDTRTMINGEECWFNTNLQPMPVKNGDMGMVQLIARDVTKQKKAEHALIESEEKFREVFNNANDAICVYGIDENGVPENFIEVNDLMCLRLGYSRDDFMNMGPQDIINRNYRLKIPQLMEKILEEGWATFEVEQITKQGEEIPVEINSHLFTLRDEKRVLAICRDISKRKRYEEHLQRIQAAVEGTSDAIAIFTPQGVHFYHNPAFTDIFGYSTDELKGPGGTIKIYSDPDFGLNILETIIKGNRWSGELKVTDKDGRNFPVHLRADAIKNEEKDVIGLIFIFTDITDSVKTRSSLKESEEKFRNLAQTAVDAIIITGSFDEIVFSNRSLERIFGYDEHEVIGQNMDMLIPERYMEDFQVMVDHYHLQTTDRGNLFETYGLRKDRSEFPVEMSMNSWNTEDDIYTTFIIRDITQRKLNEFKFKMREDIFQLMAQNIEEVFWIIDPLTGQILYMSPSFQKVWGDNIENLYQNPRSWIESIHPDDKDNFISYIFGKPGRTSINREGIDCRVVRHDNEIRWIKVRAFPVFNQNKEIYRRVGIATDITKIRKIKDLKQEQNKKNLSHQPNFKA